MNYKIYNVFSSKFDILAHKSFKYYTLNININNNENIEHFAKCKYKMVIDNNNDNDDNNAMYFKYSDEIEIKADKNDSVIYKLYILNRELFDMNKYIYFQTINLSEYTLNNDLFLERIPDKNSNIKTFSYKMDFDAFIYMLLFY